MDMDSEPHLSAGYAQQEELMMRLSPETEMEERLTRQMAFCNTKLEQIEALIGKAQARMQQVLHELNDETVL